jgi:hypothetical protein
LQGVADQAIAAGELCTLFESGVIRRTDPTLPWDAINQKSSQEYTIYQAAPILNISMSGMTVNKGCGNPARLKNGTYIVPMQTSSGVGFSVRSSGGLQVSLFVQVSSDNSNVPPYCVPLQNGNHAIIWHVGASMKFGIYSPLGTVIVAPVTVETSCYVAGQVPWHGHCLLANGNIALTWATTGNILRTQIFEPAGGTAVTSVIAVDSAIYGGMHCARPCANGDYILSCFDGNHNLHKIYRMSNSGSAVWGPQTPSTATAIFSSPDAPRMHPQHNRMIELSNGNIAWVLPASSSSTYANIFILNSSGVLQKAVDPGVLYHDAGVAFPISIAPNGFAIGHANANIPNTYASFYDTNGNPLQINTIVDTTSYTPPTGSSPTVNLYMGFAGSGFGLGRYFYNSGNVEARLFHLDHRGSPISAPITHQAYNPSDCSAPAPHCDTDGMIFTSFFSAGPQQCVVAVSKTGASAIVGAAQSDAAAGATVTIIAAGYFTLPSTQVFGVGHSFDMRDLPILGVRGTVGGQNAVLAGWTL